ncbi:MAG: hypothetical protein ABW163_09415 [Luteimonas sp.]
MHDTPADPPRPSTAHAARRRTPRQILDTLTLQLRLRPHVRARHFEWTVEVSGMCDADLEAVVALLASRGLQATYTRELGWFAHFVLRW